MTWAHYAKFDHSNYIFNMFTTTMVYIANERLNFQVYQMKGDLVWQSLGGLTFLTSNLSHLLLSVKWIGYLQHTQTVDCDQFLHTDGLTGNIFFRPQRKNSFLKCILKSRSSGDVTRALMSCIHATCYWKYRQKI